MAKDNAKKSDN